MRPRHRSSRPSASSCYWRRRIEVYVPAPKRMYGYFVLPVLLGDELVARLDLKADRRASSLLVQAAHVEEGAEVIRVAAAVAVELEALRGWLGLDTVRVGAAGNLALALRRSSQRPDSVGSGRKAAKA
ncbi:MAG: DNA glycosylase AlkZ-like family protein [Acidimicrobiales bacterium]